MLTYADLRDRFDEFESAKAKYWDDLAKAAQQLLKEFETSLELESKTWEKLDDVHNYADIGVFVDGEFKRRGAFSLEKEGNYLKFVIKLDIHSTKNPSSRFMAIQRISLYGKGPILVVQIEGQNGKDFSVARGDQEGRFVKVVEAIKQKIMESVNPSQYKN